MIKWKKVEIEEDEIELGIETIREKANNYAYADADEIVFLLDVVEHYQSKLSKELMRRLRTLPPNDPQKTDRN